MPALYLVATPIGNLEDITLRALQTLKEVKLIAAEDTRTTRKLLSHYNISTPLTSYHEHNKQAKLGFLLKQLEEKDVALVSEAGMPGLSDPGYELALACIERGVPVIPVPGPSAIPTALVVSGLPSQPFLYLGFLPRRKSERKRLLEAIAPLPYTLIFLETPHRLRESLEAVREALSDRKIAICRELTKLHEEVFRGTVSEALEHFSMPRGEFTLVVAGREEERAELTPEIRTKLQQLKGQGLSFREALAHLAHRPPRRELYRAWLEIC